MIQYDLFSDDERQYLNSIVKGHNPETIARKYVLDAVGFARDVADDSDAMILDLIDRVYSKVHSLTDEEWKRLRVFLPFPVNISFWDADYIPDEDTAV